jgi:hypothetical protein
VDESVTGSANFWSVLNLRIVYALTIIASAVGEWNYYILGSAIEIALLAALVYYAWTWPKEHPRHTLPAAVLLPRPIP